MKICAACHKDLPKQSYSKKQWKLDQRRCKVCITNNREVQSIPTKQHNNEIIKSLNSLCLKNIDRKISDEELFKQPPKEDCPICFVRIPLLIKGSKYMACCGKEICNGCIHAPVYDNQGNIIAEEKCPFCRTPRPNSEDELIERLTKRMKANDAKAMYNLGCCYSKGSRGKLQDIKKALELFYQAAELGHGTAYCNVGYAYDNGEGVEVDEKKATYYFELGAMAGDINARHNLGIHEWRAGNLDRALKHWLISAGCGDNDSLDAIKLFYKDGQVTKEDYTKALRLYQEYLSEIRSTQRDKAAAADEEYHYY